MLLCAASSSLSVWRPGLTLNLLPFSRFGHVMPHTQCTNGSRLFCCPPPLWPRRLPPQAARGAIAKGLLSAQRKQLLTSCIAVAVCLLLLHSWLLCTLSVAPPGCCAIQQAAGLLVPVRCLAQPGPRQRLSHGTCLAPQHLGRA